MTAWTTISNGLVAVGAKPFATTIQALRDNPVAISEGAVGAPRIAFEALDTWYVTAGEVGTYCFAKRGSGSADVAFGSTLAGSSLRPTSAFYSAGDFGGSGSLTANVGSALSGTWQCMGTYDHILATTGTAGGGGATLWLRIS